MYDSDTLACAYIWQGPGNSDATQACTKCDGFRKAQLEDGYGKTQQAGSNRVYPVGSIMVMPGCTFHGFHEPNYSGDFWPYPEGTYPLIHLGKWTTATVCGEKVWGFKSIKCECKNIGTASSSEAPDSSDVSDEVAKTVQTAGLFVIKGSEQENGHEVCPAPPPASVFVLRSCSIYEDGRGGRCRRTGERVSLFDFFFKCMR